MENERTPVNAEYEKMKQDREMWLSAAKEAAKYTLPSIVSDDTLTKAGGTTRQVMSTPNQSIGADGVNNLAAKVTMTLLPPNQTFFRFKMDKDAIKQAAQASGQDEAKYASEVNKGLANLETLLLDYMEASSDRVCLGEALKHLYITGNVLLIYDPKNGLKYYPLSRFVIKRDYCGNVQKAITEEKIGFFELPEKIQEQIILKYSTEASEELIQKLAEKEFTLYTCFRRCKKVWKVYQEVEGFIIEESIGQYPIEVCPFIALRYVRVDGESYGRGLIEEYIGDISYLDTLCLAIKQSSLAGSKLLMLVNPSGQTNIRQLSTAKNGDFVRGKADDVMPLQANKYNDLQVAQAEADKIERRLNRIFVMKAAIQRDAERVTAEEIRQMAADLEEALGNHYSLMAKEFQLAYTKLVYFHLRKAKKSMLPDLIRAKEIKLTITTGLEALGKTSDLNKLVTFFQVIGQLAQSAQVVGAKTDKLIEMVATSLNLDVTGMFATEEEKQQMQQAMMQEQLMQKVAPNVVNKMGDMALQAQAQQTNQEGEQ